MFAEATSVSSTTDLLSILASAGGPTVVAILAVSLWREWLVPGTRYRALQKERDDLQAAVLDKVIPAVTEANLTMRQLGQALQTNVTVRRPE